MNRANPLIDPIAPGKHPTATVQCREDTADSVAGPPGRLIGMVGAACPASSLRLTLASQLGNKIDGAWWPRTALISRELPDLVSVLEARLGQVIDINVNWSSLQRQPDLNWGWWQGIHPQIMTVVGRDAQAKLLMVPHRTGTALAVMVLRRAAGLPVYPIHHDSRAFKIAECIVRVAQGESMFEVRHARRAKVQAVADPSATRV
jgi:Family of unknown function (DUF5994)